MGRRKGSKNKQSVLDPLHSVMPNEDRLHVLARLNVNPIAEDQTNGRHLITKIGAQDQQTLA